MNGKNSMAVEPSSRRAVQLSSCPAVHRTHGNPTSNEPLIDTAAPPLMPGSVALKVPLARVADQPVIVTLPAPSTVPEFQS
jgi:hypothetical protein